MKILRHKTINQLWRKQFDRQKENRTGGFTLVELIVVLVVLAILCTVGVMGIIGWQQHADFKKQNQFAQNIFVAAQTQLTQYAERGQLTELMDGISDTGKADFAGYRLGSRLGSQGKLTSSTGVEFHAGDDSLWQEYETKGMGANKGQIYYLKVKKGDYQTYQKELKGLPQEEMKKRPLEERRIRLLYDMLDPYIADKSMLDAAICLEFDPDPKVALIYSVFYNEKAEAFTYDGGDGTKVVSIRDRREQSRREENTGYYGAEVLSRGTDTYIARPVISNVSLTNSDSLSLTWSVNSEEALQGLIYNLKIYAAADSGNANGNLVATIALGKGDELELSVKDGFVDGVYNRINQAEEEKDRQLKFPIVIDRFNQTITLVLDGLDVGVDEGSREDDFTNSASIRRLRLNQVENLYISVSGSREGTYRLTAEKRSNAEHQFFGGLQKQEGSNPQQYTIENARHLYNIRYYEQSNTQKIIYRMTSDIDWNKTGTEKWIYKNGIVQLPKTEDEVPHFKPILSLGANEVLMSEDAEKPYQIQNLKLDISDVPVISEKEIPNTIGLFVKNQGRIENLILDKIMVTGSEEDATGATGAFCGENSGSLVNLTVNSGSITGGANVGGIAGKIESTGKIEGAGTYEKLINRADVIGRLYVGGIAGSIIGTTNHIVVEKCENYGRIRGKVEENKESYFIGGIAGYTEGKSEALVTLNRCNNTPIYTEEEIKQLTEQLKKGEKYGLTGTYVGGIVGFNQGAFLNECSTLQGEEGAPTYIIGNEYVGGIAGFYSGISGADDKNQNQANVIGINFVGGITGCNARADLNQTTPVIRKREEPLLVSSSWVNKGNVLGLGSYVGGIAGCNYEALVNCSSTISDNPGDNPGMEELMELSYVSRYVGGITGYNAGDITRDITSSNVISTIRMISGSDFVGGIVGYNDITGTVSGYEVQGEAVRGNKFVGGFVGLNASEQIFGQTITCNLNEVSGQYFVGGAIGGNLMPTSKLEIKTDFLTNHFTGKVTAEQGAFAGGFIGYNHLLARGTTSSRESEIAGEIETVANNLCKVMPVTTTDLKVASKQLSEEEDMLQKSLLEFKDDTKNTTSKMIITGVEGTTAQTKPEGITAMVYAGGVVGYNHNETKLQIQNVENITPVTATAYIETEEEGIGESKRFSYAGGIIGKVSANVTLDNCQNQDVSLIKTMGTYTGGLTEINYGLIQNCTVEMDQLGEEETSYIGGLVGVNATTDASKGLVNCKVKVSGAITGKDYVGGMVAENYGRIQNPTVDCTIIASGQHVGGVAAYGYEGSTIILEEEIKVSIKGSASNVGGVIGTNEGSIESLPIKSILDTKTEIAGQSNVGGFVGVQKKTATLKGLVNYAQIQAEEGYAGGIVAWVTKGAKDSEIANCENFGSVEVLYKRSVGEDLEEAEVDNQSAAGGITAINHGTILCCVNQASISTGEGYSGGITGINNGTITQSRVGLSGAETIEITGDLLVGGIAARNEKGGIIKDSSVQNLILRNEKDGEADSEARFMGGVSAENLGTIKNCVVGVEWNPEIKDESMYENWYKEAAVMVSEALSPVPNKSGHPYSLLPTSDSLPEYSNAVVLISNSADTSVGGVVGINTGTIEGYSGDRYRYAVVAAELRITSNDGYLGGIAGINQGSISGYEFNGLIHGAAGYGYGGIAGLNEKEKEATKEATISDCKINVARIQAIGVTDDKQTGVGGVAGINGVGATITGIQFGNIDELKPITISVENTTYEGSVWVGADTYGQVGGVAGYNQGTITDINQWQQYALNRESYFNGSQKPTQWEVATTGVLVVNAMGPTGGIVGLNQGEGSVSQALTGSSWLIYAKQPKEEQKEAYGCGGIIGQWESGESGESVAGGLKQCDNYGTVKANGQPAGGVVALFSQSLAEENVSITDSQNHGDITTQDAECGGIVGGIDGDLNLSLFNVVNTGLITGTGDAAGLVASKNWASLNLSYSRNYGYSGNESFAGLSIKAPTAMETCFGLTDQNVTSNPIFIGDGSSDGGYYFKSLEAQTPGIPLIIVENKAVTQDGTVRIGDLGRLSLAEILLTADGEDRKKNSKLSYDLYQRLDRYIQLEQEVINPERLVITPILPVQSTAPSQTYFIETEDVKKVSKKLAARQTQVTWDYEIDRDFYIDGYDIHIRSVENEDYDLQLDVSRDDLGEFPGLQEYMEPEGKLLYEVSYDLDGNMIPSVEVASPSDAEKKTASFSNVASPSDSDKGLVYVQLNATLKAERIHENGIVTGIHFTLILPDVSFGCWEGDYEEEYLEAYPEGMYRTEAIVIIPWMGSSYDKEPEEEWFYLDKTLLEV